MSSKLKRTLALAALMTGAAGVANATEGWYGRADAGYSVDGSFENDSTGYAWGDGNFENDWSQHLGLGYAFANGFRLEGELGHRFNEIEPTATIDRGGDVHAYTGMLNLFYDFARGSRFEPYLGLGVGMARVNVSQHDDTPPPLFTVNDEDSVLAYQGLAGVAIGLTERLDLDIGYRYLVANSAELVSLEPASTSHEGDYTPPSGDGWSALAVCGCGSAATAAAATPAASASAAASAGSGCMPDVGIRCVLRVGSLEPQPSGA
ncbi:outer membrane protein A precursor [alpha proteobacterium U9-1i]|nr:outer membrane protein A precursor [alpha proteobacterium U9-1i]